MDGLKGNPRSSWSGRVPPALLGWVCHLFHVLCSGLNAKFGTTFLYLETSKVTEIMSGLSIMAGTSLASSYLGKYNTTHLPTKCHIFYLYTVISINARHIFISWNILHPYVHFIFITFHTIPFTPCPNQKSNVTFGLEWRSTTIIKLIWTSKIHVILVIDYCMMIKDKGTQVSTGEIQGCQALYRYEYKKIPSMVSYF